KIREVAVQRMSYHVARSLTGVFTEESWAWRRRLVRKVPDQVLNTLKGLVTDRAHALREALWETFPEEALRSLGRVGDARSWGFRCRALRSGPTAGLADSLSGLETSATWE